MLKNAEKGENEGENRETCERYKRYSFNIFEEHL